MVADSAKPIVQTQIGSSEYTTPPLAHSQCAPLLYSSLPAEFGSCSRQPLSREQSVGLTSAQPTHTHMSSADALEARLQRWEDRLRSLTTQTLTTDYVRPDPPRIVEAVHSVTLPESTRIALLQLSILDGSNPFPPFTILLAAFAILSFRLTGDEDISLGTSSEVKEPFVLRTPISGQKTFQELLNTVKHVRVLPWNFI